MSFPDRSSSSLDEDEERKLLSESTEPFLLMSSLKSTTRRAWEFHVYLFCLHFALLILIGILLSHLHTNDEVRPLRGESWSPIQKYMEYEARKSHATGHHYHSLYHGKPNHEQAEAWRKLTEPLQFNASRSELNKAGESLDDIARLTDGGYVAVIGVYHELHCLQNIRYFLYKDYYYANLTQSNIDYINGHLDHCLEALRLTIMCYGNTAMYSFAWDAEAQYKPMIKSNAKSSCAKWDNIETWARSRMVDSNLVLGKEESGPRDNGL